MKNLHWVLMTACLSVSLCVSSVAWSDTGQTVSAEEAPKTIVNVKIEGNDTLSENAVRSYIKTREGVVYDEQMLKDDRDRLMASGRFSSVEAARTYTPKGVEVVFRVKERETVESIDIRGAKTFEGETLKAELPFFAGDPLNPASVESGKQAILNKYREKGYYFASVEIDKAALANRKVVYTVVEGPNVVVKKVRFQGNQYYKNIQLSLRTETKAKLWPFIAGTLDLDKLESDLLTIRNLYISEGFLDCEVGRELTFSDDKTEATIIFIIREGPRYRVNEVIFRGNTLFGDEELARRLNLQQGRFLTSEDQQHDVRRIEAAYGELGYIHAVVTPSKQFVDPRRPVPNWARHLDGGQPALVNFVLDIEEHDQYRIGSIRIQGNSITQERVIRRELSFRPEQLYNTVAVDHSESRLKELQLFNKVEINPVPPADQARGVRDVLVEVEEGKTAEFLVGVGVSTNSGLLGTVSFRQRNFDILGWPGSFKNWHRKHAFKGAGQTFSIVAEPGTEFTRVTVGWSTPYIYDQPYSLSGKLFLYDRGQESYDETHLGTQWSVGHRFKNRWYGQLSMRYENVDLQADNDAPLEVMEDDGDHTLVGLQGALVRDRTDSRWLPSRGDRFRFSYEQVVGTDTFGQFNASYSKYYTVYTDALDRKHILAGRVSYGHIVGDAPVFEKFYGGGLGSVRGFQYRGISPRGTRANGTKHDDPIGGDMMLFAGGEYTFPIATKHIRGVVFLDSGTVEEDFTITDYRVSAGFGLRWTIPFFGPVPMSLDFGFPIVKGEDDEEQLLSFSLGWTF